MSSLDDLWCSDCGKSHEGMCRKHGALHKVQDAVIPSRARLTLPPSLTLKSVKENGSVQTAIFAKRVIPVRSQFGPLEAPVISKAKLESRQKKATTVWKKKNAMQKSMETLTVTQNNEVPDMNQSSADLQSPIIANVRSLQNKGNHSVGAEVPISSIQQLMSMTSQSISQSAMGDSGLLSLQAGLNQLPLQSTPIHNHSTLNQLQHSLQELPGMGFPNGPGNIQLSPENLHAQQYHVTFGHPDLSSVQQNLNLSDFVSAAALHHSVGSDQSAANLLLGQPLESDSQSAEDSGVVDSSHVNVSDSTATDVTSDTELDDSTEQDMSFEFKILAEDSNVELYDTTDEEHCNWMIFVRPAKSIREQNLIAYQEEGQIYFVSLKPIAANTELKVWYSREYARSINKGMLPQESANRRIDDNKLQCLQCEVKCSDQEEMENHVCVSKVKGRRKGRPRKYVKPTKTWRAKLEKTKIKEPQPPEDSKQIKTLQSITGNEDTPVKRGRGRPRTKPVSVANEQSKLEQNVIKAGMQHTAQQPMQQQHQKKQQEADHSFRFNMEDSYDQMIANEEEDHYLNIDEDNDDIDDDDDDSPLKNELYKTEGQDPLFEEKKLVITEERPKKKRGPKSCKSPMNCPHCGESFQAEAAFHLHVYSHTGKKPFTCTVQGCDRGFLSKFKLERHLLIHSSPRHHKCLYCDKSFNRKDHLKNHMITHDPNKKIWKCEICGKEYSYSFSYRTHMAFHAAERGETLSCGICKKSFENKEQLLFHLKVHTGARAAKNSTEKTHQCVECWKKFFTRKDVKRHLITHTKRKDFLCQFCPQRFGRKDHLTRHLRTTHTGDNQSSGRSRRHTGDSSTTSPSKAKRERAVYTQVEPTMVPLQMAIPNMQPEDIQEQLINGVAAASQPGSMAATQATLLQNLQYAVSQMPGHHGAARDIQIPTALYEAAAAASAQQQQEQQQQQQLQQDQVAQIAAASINNIQPPPGMPTIQHSGLPMQYQINEKGYVLNNTQQEQAVVRQIQVSPNVEYKHITQQLQGNMYITAVTNSSSLQHQQQVQQIQLQQAQPQQHQMLLAAGKIEQQPIEITRANAIATALQQPPEYQIATAQPVSSMVQSNASATDQNGRAQVLMASPVDTRQNPHSQAYSTLLGYYETLRFLENLPTNNTNTIPLQQIQAVNVDISQGQTAQLIPAQAYNTVSGSNILNINQADLAKGVVTIQHPHAAAALQLTPQDIKNVVSLAQTVTPVQHVTYQQQPS